MSEIQLLVIVRDALARWVFMSTIYSVYTRLRPTLYTIYGFRERTARRRRPVDASGYETLSVKITVHHKSGGRMNHGFRMSFHGCVTIRDVIIDVM